MRESEKRAGMRDREKRGRKRAEGGIGYKGRPLASRSAMEKRLRALRRASSFSMGSPCHSMVSHDLTALFSCACLVSVRKYCVCVCVWSLLTCLYMGSYGVSLPLYGLAADETRWV
jgi:hypothetical protein